MTKMCAIKSEVQMLYGCCVAAKEAGSSWCNAHRKALLESPWRMPAIAKPHAPGSHLYIATRAQLITWLSGRCGLRAFAGLNADVGQPRRF